MGALHETDLDLDFHSFSDYQYTGGIQQGLDSDVHSFVTAKTRAALLQRKRAQRVDSSGSDNAEVTMCTLV